MKPNQLMLKMLDNWQCCGKSSLINWPHSLSLLYESTYCSETLKSSTGYKYGFKNMNLYSFLYFFSIDVWHNSGFWICVSYSLVWMICNYGDQEKTHILPQFEVSCMIQKKWFLPCQVKYFPCDRKYFPFPCQSS